MAARLNIEKRYWTDKRRERLLLLVGEVADSRVIKAWLLAQEYWYPRLELIPYKVWLEAGLSDELMKVGLADTKEISVRGRVQTFVYVRGSKKHFAWLFQLKVAGKRSAAKRALKREELKNQEVADQQPLNSGSTADPTGVQPLSLSPSPNLSIPGSPDGVDKSAEPVDNSERQRGEAVLRKLQKPKAGGGLQPLF